MTLEDGVFCVFPAPGSPMPDPRTGLPGVRISEAPGSPRNAVSIRTFRDDGWLDGTAALVRVNEGPVQILVTIYQSRQAADQAPRLQVLRLTGDAAEAAPAAAHSAADAPAEPAGPAPDALAHVQRTGDVGGTFGEWIGTRGSGLWIEGFGLAPSGPVKPEDLEYQAVLGRGWLSPWVDGGKFCGSRGMALPLLGMNVRLKGNAAKRFKLSYTATFVDGSAAGPVPAGESCEAESLAALEAFKIDLLPLAVGAAAVKKPAAPRPAASRKKAPAPARAARR
jgi:hypothetical protein